MKQDEKCLFPVYLIAYDSSCYDCSCDNSGYNVIAVFQNLKDANTYINSDEIVKLYGHPFIITRELR